MIGSLFSGCGGLDMGVQAVLGGEVAWHFEYDAAPSKILAHHWPDVPNHGDVTTVDWANVQSVEVLTAGYPCQPFSIAGKRKGSHDERHLWPYVLTAIRHLRPRLVVLENVRGHLTLGFDRVLGDLAEAGYDTQWVCLPASDAGAPHRRERIFIVAHSANVGHEWSWLARDGRAGFADGGYAPADSAYYHRGRGSGTRTPGWGPYEAAINRWAAVIGRLAPAPTRPDGRDDGERLNPEFVEWMMGLPAGHVTSVGLTRNEELKILGNSVVPQQAELALRLLLPLAVSS